MDAWAEPIKVTWAEPVVVAATTNEQNALSSNDGSRHHSVQAATSRGRLPTILEESSRDANEASLSPRCAIRINFPVIFLLLSAAVGVFISDWPVTRGICNEDLFHQCVSIFYEGCYRSFFLTKSIVLASFSAISSFVTNDETKVALGYVANAAKTGAIIFCSKLWAVSTTLAIHCKNIFVSYVTDVETRATIWKIFETSLSWMTSFFRMLKDFDVGGKVAVGELNQCKNELRSMEEEFNRIVGSMAEAGGKQTLVFVGVCLCSLMFLLWQSMERLSRRSKDDNFTNNKYNTLGAIVFTEDSSSTSSDDVDCIMRLQFVRLLITMNQLKQQFHSHNRLFSISTTNVSNVDKTISGVNKAEAMAEEMQCVVEEYETKLVVSMQ